MDSTTEVAYNKEERLSKNTCRYKYKTNKEILALEVTDDKSHDGRKVMPRLIEHILKNKRCENRIRLR